MRHTFAFTCGSLGDILATAGFVAKICQKLYSPSDAPLKRELELFRESLLLTHGTIQKMPSTDFSDALVCNAIQTISDCRSEMCRFAEKIDDFEKPLSLTNISNILGRIWWATRQPHEMEQLRRTLHAYRSMLSLNLAALQLCVSSLLILRHNDLHISSYSCMSQQNNEQLQALQVSTSDVRNAARQVPPLIGNPVDRIRMSMVGIVDAFGVTIPVQIAFCGTMKVRLTDSLAKLLHRFRGTGLATHHRSTFPRGQQRK